MMDVKTTKAPRAWCDDFLSENCFPYFTFPRMYWPEATLSLWPENMQTRLDVNQRIFQI